MPRTANYNRLAWNDRFNCPTVAALRAGMKSAARSLFDKLHKHLGEYERLNETVAWYGDSWRWVVEYRVSREPEPFAVIVPSPEELQLGVPTSPKFAEKIASRRFKRAVRDGLDLASEPFDTRWAVWPVGSASMLVELLHLLDDKQSFLVRSTG